MVLKKLLKLHAVTIGATAVNFKQNGPGCSHGAPCDGAVQKHTRSKHTNARQQENLAMNKLSQNQMLLAGGVTFGFLALVGAYFKGMLPGQGGSKTKELPENVKAKYDEKIANAEKLTTDDAKKQSKS